MFIVVLMKIFCKLLYFTLRHIKKKKLIVVGTKIMRGWLKRVKCPNTAPPLNRSRPMKFASKALGYHRNDELKVKYTYNTHNIYILYFIYTNTYIYIYSVLLTTSKKSRMRVDRRAAGLIG